MVECEHLSTAVLLTAKDVSKVEPQHWACAKCKSRKSPWICLACGVVHCGRYINGHAKEHAEQFTGHRLCMDQNLSVYCYVDDEYVVNDNRIIQLLRTRIGGELGKTSALGSCDSDNDMKPPPSKMQKHPSPVGLINLGNTCFMNAILQSLNNLEQFYLFFKKLPSLDVKMSTDVKRTHKYSTRRNGDIDEISLVEEVRKISCALWEEGSGAYSPDSLFAVVWKLVPKFRGYQQQDAHEFMRYLLDKLHTELIQVRKPQHKTGQSIVSDIFEGILQSDVSCLTCRNESRKLDPILDISLDIPKKDKKKTSPDCHLSDCLDSFTDLETLQESEWYYCPRCKSRRPSTKQLSIQTLSNVLTIHLKRFHFTAFSRTKIDTMVHFPFRGLDMSSYIARNKGSTGEGEIYDLAAIVVHHGSGWVFSCIILGPILLLMFMYSSKKLTFL